MSGRAYQSSTIGLLQHISRGGDMTADQLEPLNPGGTVPIKIRLASMVKRGTICRKGTRGHSVYCITEKGREAINARAKGAANLLGTQPFAKPAAIKAKRWSASVEAIAANSYQGRELQPYQGRPGAMDAFQLPSRMGNWLHYRDGRVERIATAQEAA